MIDFKMIVKGYPNFFSVVELKDNCIEIWVLQNKLSFNNKIIM